jgi:hypothetical protein
MTVATGRRLPLNTQAPLTLPGMLSTADTGTSQGLPFRLPAPDYGNATAVTWAQAASRREHVRPVSAPCTTINAPKQLRAIRGRHFETDGDRAIPLFRDAINVFGGTIDRDVNAFTARIRNAVRTR